jgi:hypothetical protein
MPRCGVSLPFGRQCASGAAWGGLLCATMLLWPKASMAQSIDYYFPQGSYGYDQQLGVTVQTRAHPLYEPLGVQIGGFNVHPSVDESLFYNSNVTGVPGSGSWGSRTSAAVSAGSDWTRNSVGASIGVDHFQYFSLPSDSYTNWSIGLGAGYTIADSQLLAAYSHQSYYQLGTAIGKARSVTPVLNQTDSAGLQYTFNFGRISITPNLGVSAYRFGPTTSLGVTFNQDNLNYNSFAAGVTGRYALDEQSGLLAIMRVMDFTYLTRLAGQPSNDSKTVQLLTGIDYQPEGVWRYRLLGGVEVRKFSASQYATRIAPDVEASVIWSPTGLTTLSLTLASSIQAPQIVGTSGYILSQGNLVVDHELLRNVLLHGHGGIQHAEYLQAGSQTSQTQFSGGAGVTWLINRAVRLSLDYGYTSITGGNVSGSLVNPETLTIGNYNQSLLSLTLHLAL